MRFLDFLILILLLFILGIGVVLLWTNIPNLPGQKVQQQEFNLDKKDLDFGKGIQFYPRMRYKNRTISYTISDSCDSVKRKDIEKAFSILDQQTILNFKSISDGEISVLCSDIAPEPKEEGHFIAGEGGPSEIINTSNYAVILSGKVSFYRRTAECVRPNVALHEILHALGFDHNKNKESIMYPVTECGQILDGYIIDKINELYSVDSAPDLVIEKIKATKTGRYLGFEIAIGNFGLQNSLNSSLIVYSDETEVKTFYLENIDIGTRKILKVDNLRGPLTTDRLIFEVKSNENELDKDNNIARMKLVNVEG